MPDIPAFADLLLSLCSVVSKIDGVPQEGHSRH